MTLEDPAGLLSRTHVEVHSVNGEVVVIDRGSTNGVFMREPAQHDWTRIPSWQQVTWRPGSYLQIGGRILRLYEETAPVSQSGPRVTMHHHVPRESLPGRASAAVFPTH